VIKKQASRNLITLLLFGAILIVALNTWMAFHSIQVLLNSEFWVQHTLQVERQVERIMSLAKDAETGNRGFLITGDDAYLEPYTTALKALPGELDTFKTVTADNPVQQRNLVEMRAVLEQRLALLQQGIDERRQRDARDEMHALVLSGTGKLEMDRLRGIADRMEGEERRLLVIRMAEAQTNSVRARLAIGLASMLDFLLLMLMFRFLSTERALRLESEQAAVRLALAQAEAEKNAREALANANEVRQLNATLEERVRRRTIELEATNRELEAFSYSVSHDLRAPLRTIDGFSLALEEDYANAIDDVGRDYILRVRTGVQRMGQLIDALLQLSRITRAELSREDFDLSEIAGQVAQELAAQNSDRQIEFRVEAGLRANADPKLIRIALENLLGNAVKFSGKVDQPVVEFGWDPAADAWFVRDNGAGFDMYYAEKLFNAFNRLHGDKDFKGSGIGLATVARVVRRHHGRIWADSVVHHGATFWFTLG